MSKSSYIKYGILCPFYYLKLQCAKLTTIEFFFHQQKSKWLFEHYVALTFVIGKIIIITTQFCAMRNSK